MTTSDGRVIHQLADGDAVFVAMETAEAPCHIAGLSILDPATRADFGFETFLEVLSQRIALIPRLRWKLREVPLGLDCAYWIEDPAFDVREHVRRVALAAPGDRTTLARLSSFLHAQPLDRARPLWECWWIEGLESGRIAVLIKLHHCLVDGQSGMGLTEILMDLSPEPGQTPIAATGAEEGLPRAPKPWEMGRRVVENGLRRQARMAMHAGRALRAFARVPTALPGALVRALPQSLFAGDEEIVPRVSWNASRLSRHRDFAFTKLPLSPLRELKKHFGVKLNDVLLALVGGALRSVLLERGELPEASLVALCPVSLREAGDQSMGNQLTSMPVRLATHLADPVERLRAIHESADGAKQRTREGAFEFITALGESLAPAALHFVMQTAHRAPRIAPMPGNLVCSNVRGLPIPTYMAGARVEELYPMSMLQVGSGMNVTAVSHDDQVDVGFLVDPRLVPDPWLFADRLAEVLAELEAAAARTTAKPPRAPRVEIPAEGEPVDLAILMATVRRKRGPR
ncbi:MAG: wax ester/triacylglycerol synthase family O-acyltransferase [Deltaproteobacteria bacterium]|nr:wax ester/triacylglycerol synthase family O-acyltransferase [Deltaproteobacteria bacterium]